MASWLHCLSSEHRRGRADRRRRPTPLQSRNLHRLRASRDDGYPPRSQPLDRAAAAKPIPGRPAIHRLNRAEYKNAVRDLLAVNIDAESLLPTDEVDQGFDNLGDALSVTPVLLERYMSAARKIGRWAIGEPKIRPFSEKYELSRFLTQDDRMSDALPFGSRGGIAIRHDFPADGVYTIRVFLQRNSRDYIRGLPTSIRRQSIPLTDCLAPSNTADRQDSVPAF